MPTKYTYCAKISVQDKDSVRRVRVDILYPANSEHRRGEYMNIIHQRVEDGVRIMEREEDTPFAKTIRHTLEDGTLGFVNRKIIKPPLF